MSRRNFGLPHPALVELDGLREPPPRSPFVSRLVSFIVGLLPAALILFALFADSWP